MKKATGTFFWVTTTAQVSPLIPIPVSPTDFTALKAYSAFQIPKSNCRLDPEWLTNLVELSFWGEDCDLELVTKISSHWLVFKIKFAFISISRLGFHLKFKKMQISFKVVFYKD